MQASANDLANPGISTDADFASDYADDVFLIKNGQTFAQGTPEIVLTREGVEALYDLPSQRGKWALRCASL